MSTQGKWVNGKWIPEGQNYGVSNAKGADGGMVFSPGNADANGWTTQNYTDANGLARTVAYDGNGSYQVFSNADGSTFGYDGGADKSYASSNYGDYALQGPDGNGTIRVGNYNGTYGSNAGDGGIQWGGKDGALATGAQVVNAASGVMNAVTDWKKLGLAEKSFEFDKAAANKNLLNQGTAFNSNVDRQAAIAARLRAGAETDPTKLAAIKNQVGAEYATKKMNVTPIG